MLTLYQVPEIHVSDKCFVCKKEIGKGNLFYSYRKMRDIGVYETLFFHWGCLEVIIDKEVDNKIREEE